MFSFSLNEKLTLKVRFWHFLAAIFGHVTLKKNQRTFCLQSWLQSEMFWDLFMI